MSEKFDRFFVTGATGFVGANLLRRLVTLGNEVHVLVRPNASRWRMEGIEDGLIFHTGGLLEEAGLKKIVREAKPSIIYHLGTYGAYPDQTDPDRIVMTNFLGTWNLLRAADEVDYRLFVNTGSSSEYGFKSYAMRETDLLEPSSYYAATKCAQSLICTMKAAFEKKPIVTLRLFSVYGQYEDPGRFIPTLLRACLRGGSMKLVSPETARDFIHVDDVVDVCLRVDDLASHPGEVFNIGTGIQSTIGDATEAALRVTGAKVDLEWGKMKARVWDTTTWVADVSKAGRLLGWRARIMLEEGLRRTWEWFRGFYGR